MTTDRQTHKSSNRAALTAVGMLSILVLALGMFSRGWMPRGQFTDAFEPCTIPLIKIETRVNDKIVDSSLKAIRVRISDVNGLMLLDTGANRTMLSLDFCKEHSLLGRWIELDPKATNIAGTHLFHVEENLSIGPLRFRRYPFFAFENNLLSESLVGAPIIGILGTDILNRFSYCINFPDNLLRIGAAQEIPGEAERRIPISIRNGKIFVNMDIQTNRFEFRLDTGSNRANLSEEHLAFFEKDVYQTKQTWNDINGWHTQAVNQVDLSDIRLGAVSFEKLTFSIRGNGNRISAAMLKDLTVSIYPAQEQMTLTSHGSVTQNQD